MKKILNIVSSVKGEESYSVRLSNALLDKLSAVYPGSTVKTHDLTRTPFPHLEESHFTAFYMPDENRSEADRKAIAHSDEAIREIMEADIVVIGVPIYNFTIPSTLKAWIDHIIRAGVTFRYTDGQAEGLIREKKAYLAIASGGVYTEGPMMSYDFSEPYLRKVLGFIGITDITVFRVEGVLIPGVKETALPKAIHSIEEFAY